MKPQHSKIFSRRSRKGFPRKGFPQISQIYAEILQHFFPQIALIYVESVELVQAEVSTQLTKGLVRQILGIL